MHRCLAALSTVCMLTPWTILNAWRGGHPGLHRRPGLGVSLGLASAWSVLLGPSGVWPELTPACLSPFTCLPWALGGR